MLGLNGGYWEWEYRRSGELKQIERAEAGIAAGAADDV
jgi:hypothetical protein